MFFCFFFIVVVVCFLGGRFAGDVGVDVNVDVAVGDGGLVGQCRCGRSVHWMACVDYIIGAILV